MVLKDLLEKIPDSCVYIETKDHKPLSSDMQYNHIFPYLEKEVIKITTNGFEYITIVLDM